MVCTQFTDGSWDITCSCDYVRNRRLSFLESSLTHQVCIRQRKKVDNVLPSIVLFLLYRPLVVHSEERHIYFILLQNKHIIIECNNWMYFINELGLVSRKILSCFKFNKITWIQNKSKLMFRQRQKKRISKTLHN